MCCNYTVVHAGVRGQRGPALGHSLVQLQKLHSVLLSAILRVSEPSFSRTGAIR